MSWRPTRDPRTSGQYSTWNSDSRTASIGHACSKQTCSHETGRSRDLRGRDIEPLVPEPLSETERFLQPYQIYRFLLMRREVGALLAGDQRDRTGKGK